MHVDDRITRQAWEASPLAILTLDAEGGVRFVNPAGVRMFRREERHVVGQPIADLTHPLDRLALGRMLEVARRGEVPARQEIRFRRPDGSDVTTGFSIAPGDGTSAYTVCVLRDLSSEKALRPQLLHTERMASMGVIASVVAHELNNALAGAIGCLELLDLEANAPQSELVRTALAELERSAQLVADIKGYARSEDDMNERFELAGVLESVERLHRFQHSPQGEPLLEVLVPEGLPALEGNRNQLLQALLNLVRNAEDAAADLPEERRRVRVEVEERGDVVRIAVVDRGRGVPESLRSRLFDPFYSTKAAGAGTGLGLTVVQAVAAGHGGRVEVDETPGGGATFRLVLPAAAGPTEEGEASEEAGEPMQEGTLSGVRLLVADDEPAIRRVIELASLRFGAEIVAVGDADGAIEALGAGDFDLVLLDVRMPGGGGPAVFHHIQERRPELVPRTVFMSGQLSSEMAEVRGGGYFGILQKPFHMRQLGELLEGALGAGPGRGRA